MNGTKMKVIDKCSADTEAENDDSIGKEYSEDYSNEEFPNVEEATEVKREAYLQLKKRLRGRTQHSKHIFMAFNPILKTHWIYKDFFGQWEDNKTVYEDEDKLMTEIYNESEKHNNIIILNNKNY